MSQALCLSVLCECINEFSELMRIFGVEKIADVEEVEGVEEVTRKGQEHE